MNKTKRKAHKRKCKRVIAAVNKRWNAMREARARMAKRHEDIPF